MTADGPTLREGNRNPNVSANGEDEAEAADAVEKDGEPLRSFEWRGGSERMTTGIWMWSEPFVRRTEDGKEVAVLLIDTQGMFDNETSMGLTACIFAVSTLVRNVPMEGDAVVRIIQRWSGCQGRGRCTCAVRVTQELDAAYYSAGRAYAEHSHPSERGQL